MRQDGAGTLWAVTADADRGPWVCAGSHLDTQPDGGAYDGALGVVCALEAAAALLEADVERRHPLAVVAFVDEEGARFRVPCFGSQAITGVLDIDRVLEVMGDAAGDLRRQRPVAAGQHPPSSRRCARSWRCTSSRAGRWPNATRRWAWPPCLRPGSAGGCVFSGEANHAGTTLMPGRHDALVRAAEFVLAVRDAALARPGAVATVGRLEVSPGSTNAIPGRVAAALDVRAPQVATVEELVAELAARFADAELTRESRNDGAAFDERLRGLLDAAAAGRGIPAGDLPSYAGHDAGHAGAAPAGRDAVRAKSHRGQPHAGRVGFGGGLPGRRPGADRRPGAGAGRHMTDWPVDGAVGNRGGGVDRPWNAFSVFRTLRYSPWGQRRAHLTTACGKSEPCPTHTPLQLGARPPAFRPLGPGVESCLEVLS